MEILNNFSSIYCFIAFVIGALFMLAMLSIAAMGKTKEPRNKVRFYVARNKNNRLWLYMGKPRRYDDEFRAYLDKGSKCISGYYFDAFGLNEKDYDNLKWEDEPVEVFLNMED